MAPVRDPCQWPVVSWVRFHPDNRLGSVGLVELPFFRVMRAVMQLADRIVVLSYGRVIAAGSPAEVMGRPAVVEAYLGKAHA